uniref:Uncharacterized protein n=1 Tax=Arundo donax TaxID=35708 RepID=A0A0A9H8F2_ARUDO
MGAPRGSTTILASRWACREAATDLLQGVLGADRKHTAATWNQSHAGEDKDQTHLLRLMNNLLPFGRV